MIAAQHRTVGWLVAVSVLAAGRLAAQVPSDAHWTLEGGHGGYCVWYLADSAAARKLVPQQTQLTPAGNGAGLPTLLARTVEDEPRFASWIPGSICIHFYDRVSSDGNVIATAKPGRPIIIATSGLAASDPHGVAGASAYLLSFLTDTRAVARAAEDVGLSMATIKMTTRPGEDTGDPVVDYDVDGLLVTWTGHPTGEARVGTTQTMSFGYAGARTVSWLVEVKSTQDSTRYMAGSLEIDGRNDLAKALKASPVRVIGPQDTGGRAEITFHASKNH